jgi:ketosteroid isomerase-like protein
MCLCATLILIVVKKGRYMKMRNCLVAGTLLLATIVVCGSVFAASSDEIRVREELQSWYGKIVDSYRQKDVKAYMSLYTQDVKVRDLQGQTKDRKALEAYAREDMAATGEIHSAEFEIRELALKDNRATATGKETWKFGFTDLKGEFGPKGKSYDVVWTSPVRVRFVKTSQGWLAEYRKVKGPETLSEGGTPLVPLVKSDQGNK